MAPVIRKASVIICTYNRSALLPKVISALRAQSYPEDAFEIIVVDNASTDNTSQVVERSTAGEGVTVKYVVENRPGITFARNTGAQTARYPHLTYLDDDCSVNKDWLANLMSGFDLDKEVDITAGQIIVNFGEQNKPTWLGPKSERWLGAYNHPGSQPRLLDNPTYICEGNMVITRQAWEAVGGFLGMDAL